MTVYASDGSTITATTSPETPPQQPAEAATAPAQPLTPEPPAPEPGPDAGEAVVDAEVVTDLAVIDDDTETEPDTWEHEPDWKYDELEFHGDLLAVRIPDENALSSLTSAVKCADEVRNRLTDRFVDKHISPMSRVRVLERMSDPDDEDYAVYRKNAQLAVEMAERGEKPDDELLVTNAWADLMATLGSIGSDRVAANHAALAKVLAGKR
ncbi:hypothetical protein MPUL_00270 [Mycolicibacterium pulveris]|uniref:Tail assembly chaperone n=2 Tax=Mycolicibacterium pulveris TaxID=36813 RepID=A0A7I7UDV7_MYCPV|nr:hypothetical protein MPUL_00270 [Mycolicibacterium pulveris]